MWLIAFGGYLCGRADSVHDEQPGKRSRGVRRAVGLNMTDGLR